MKKRSPTKYIDRVVRTFSAHHGEEREQGFVKAPSPELEITYATQSSTEDSMSFNRRLLENIYKKYGKYTLIHTHPEGSVYPSMRDIKTFLKDKKQKTEIIAPTVDGENIGYLVMRKTKKTPEYGKDISELGKVYKESFGEHRNIKNRGKALKKILKKSYIQSRWFDNKQSEYEVFDNIKKSLENKVSVIILSLIFLLSLILVSSNIQGYSIFSLSSPKINWISGVLLIGLICSLIYFRLKTKTNSKIKHQKLRKKTRNR